MAPSKEEEEEEEKHMTNVVEERVCTVTSKNVEIENGHWRSEMRANKMWHRATYVIIMKNDKVWVQRRSKNKDYCPGTLDPTPGGVVAYAESYEENMQREMEEEMGLSASDCKVKSICTFPYQDERVKCWGRLYEFIIPPNGPFIYDIKIQEEEVDEVMELTLEEIRKWYIEKPSEWMPDGIHAIKLYLEHTKGVPL